MSLFWIQLNSLVRYTIALELYIYIHTRVCVRVMFVWYTWHRHESTYCYSCWQTSDLLFASDVIYPHCRKLLYYPSEKDQRNKCEQLSSRYPNVSKLRLRRRILEYMERVPNENRRIGRKEEKIFFLNIFLEPLWNT